MACFNWYTMEFDHFMHFMNSICLLHSVYEAEIVDKIRYSQLVRIATCYALEVLPNSVNFENKDFLAKWLPVRNT